MLDKSVVMEQCLTKLLSEWTKTIEDLNAGRITSAQAVSRYSKITQAVALAIIISGVK